MSEGEATVDLEALAAAIVEAMNDGLDDGAIWAEVDGVLPEDHYDEAASRRLAAALGRAWSDDVSVSCFVLSHAGRSAEIWWDDEAGDARYRITESGRDVRRVFDPARGEWRLVVREGS
ncbi:MAG: hypothetical protein KC420_18750 [Myxococcales bacterium]|nr:hypothetical protein [Myxococcales bacterium]MCB9705870.1 hypothetical protein [Myxococcales bacterium]